MSNLNSICFICLHQDLLNISLEAVVSNDAQNVSAVTEVKYVLPELMSLDPDIPVHICFSCRTTIHSFYMFKKKCLENYNHLIRNTKKIQSTSATQEQNINELEIKTYNSEPMIKLEQEVGTEFNIRNDSEELLLQDVQKTVVENNIVVKEEYTASEDSDEQCNPQLEFVKCEAASDIEQDDESSEDENHLKDSSLCSKKLTNNLDLNQTKMYKNFECSVCSKKFTQKSNLKTHMQIHSSSNEFECPVCYKKLKQYIGLQKHMIGHTGITDFECSLCHKKFSASSTLKTHMEFHERFNKELKCSVCSKTFTQKSNLYTHMKIHNGVKDYNCSICNKQFTLKSNLQKHMKTHSGARDFECSVCYKKFTQNISLQRHMVGHTGIAAFQCSKCDKKFTLKIYLQKHMKTHSNIN